MYNTNKFVWLACILLPALAMAQFNSNCTLPAHSATTILDLRPGDIKVVMAMGDSVSVGFGLHQSMNESYGRSFSMGGDSGVSTLANFFRFFNPNLVGFSAGGAPAQICHGAACPPFQYEPAAVQNNAAKSGSLVVDMVSQQITYLIRQVNQNPLINVQYDWKVLTIHIGANDLCASCAYNTTYLSPDDYQNNLMATLERVRTSIPRTFVNLVGGFNVSQAYDLSLTSTRCGNTSRLLYISCDCIFQPENGPIREIIDSSMTQFNARAQLVAQYYQRRAYDNFAVVFQPFALNTHISDLPPSFLSKLDCFHPSTYGQQAMAVALWNNMIQPSTSKQPFINMADTPLCPAADTLLYTN